MSYPERIIREHLDYLTWCKLRYGEEPSFIITKRNRSSELEKKKGSEEERLQSARTLIRGIIYRHFSKEQYLKRMVEEHPAPLREQIYKWREEGLNYAKSLLKKRKVKNPGVRPEIRNTREINKWATGIWLMSYYHGKRLDESLEEFEFTIPLIAQRLIRLKH